MAIMYKGKKIGALAYKGKKIAGIWYKGKKIYSSKLPVGFSLWSSGKAFVNGAEDYIDSSTPSYIARNATIELSKPIKQLKSGIQFNFETTKCVYFIDPVVSNGGWHFDAIAGGTFDIWNIKIPATATISASDLNSGNVVPLSSASMVRYDGGTTTLYVKKIDDTHLQISTSYKNLTNSTAGDSGSGQVYFVYIKSISAI